MISVHARVGREFSTKTLSFPHITRWVLIVKIIEVPQVVIEPPLFSRLRLFTVDVTQLRQDDLKQ